MDRTAFESLIERLTDAWYRGDAQGAAACFADDVDYAVPLRYRFASRWHLSRFFEPPPGGHRVEWHSVLFDDTAQPGALEYTYVGHHHYHGAAIVEIDQDGVISCWREWQHLDDERDWDEYLGGPAG